MKAIIAIDSFKGSLTSREAGYAVQQGIQQIHPDWETDIIAIADGGEGMLNVMLEATGGKSITLEAHDPLMQRIPATYGISADGTTAFIEMATISGLPLVPAERRNPMKTTTYGTGELIRDALEKGCTQFIIGIGGSATNDAGTGMLQALGFRFLNNERKPLGQGGEILKEIAYIDDSEKHPLLKNAHFIVACDVKNPFYGPEGAAHVFARQKGADNSMIAELDEGMRSFAHIIRKETGKDIANEPGSGAAGGMGGGLMAFLHAELQSGADLLLDICHFNERIVDVGLIITGEGRIDRQSLMGKIPGKILQRGQAHHIPVIAIAGCVEDKDSLQEAGFKGVYATKPEGMALEEAMKREIAMGNIRDTVKLLFVEK
ncbi:MAG: glycerate kinase [Bacteroides sp.]|nr:glycerate kinase [Bacteroides sp.]